jgi:DNA (cytosine-5)-methyltransferase 1
MKIDQFLRKTRRDNSFSVRLPKDVVELIRKLSNQHKLSQSEVIEASIKCLHKQLSADSSDFLTQQDTYFDNKNTPYLFINKASQFDSLNDGNKVISLFTGAGGLDIGLELAGFETAVCVEIDQHCRETLRFNRPAWKLIEDSNHCKRTIGDIRSISCKEILKTANLKKGEAALVVGGAPCQPFSNIGKKLGEDCPVNGDLFSEFVRVIEGTLPKGFIFENVSGITQAKHHEIIKLMKEQFTAIGYKISAKVLNAANYSVPQKRERFFLIGIKGNTTPAFPFPTHFRDRSEYNKFCASFERKVPIHFKKWVSLGKTFSKMPKNYKERDDYAVMKISDEVKSRMTHIGTNENFKVLPLKLRPNCWKNGKHQGVDTFGRLDCEDVSVTIRTAAYNPSKGKYIHPYEHRGLDTLELAAIQTFPKEWKFRIKGREKITLVSAGMQIGNAVPPLLGKALGEVLKRQIS